MVKFKTKIVKINTSTSTRYQITIPKALVDSDVIDPDVEYEITLDPAKNKIKAEVPQ